MAADGQSLFGFSGKLGDLKRRLLFLVGALIVYRIGAHIPVPGIDPVKLAELFNSQRGGILDMFNLFSGGALGRFTIFALGIMPYISASIIMQLMTSVVPTLEALKKEGEQGRKIINQYTRYGTVLLAALQAYGIAVGLEGAGNLISFILAVGSRVGLRPKSPAIIFPLEPSKRTPPSHSAKASSGSNSSGRSGRIPPSYQINSRAGNPSLSGN